MILPALSTQLPPFGSLEPEKFQHLTRDLLATDPRVLNAELYGISGQRQFGIDVLGHRTDGGIDAAQCKRFQSITAAEVADASDAFFMHITRWIERNAKRFILVTSADITDRHIADQILHEKQRFKANGLCYEVWGPRTLTDRLRPHRALAEKYFTQGFVDIICGTTVHETMRANAVVLHSFDDTLNLVDDDANTGLAKAQDCLRLGSYSNARKILDELTSVPRIGYLQPTTRANIYALEARYSIAISNLDAARRCITLAEKEPGGVALVEKSRFIVELQTPGSTDAILDQLAQRSEPDLQQLYAAVLYCQGRAEQADNVLAPLLQSTVPTVDTLRLKALIQLSRYDVSGAELYVARAGLLASSVPESVQITSAMISFWSAVCIAVAKPADVLWPSPPDRLLIRTDDAAVTRLRAAAASFADVARSRPPDDSFTFELKGWELASLALITTRSTEETARLKTLRSDIGFRSDILGWYSAHFIAVDIDELIAHLEQKKHSSKSLDISEAYTLATCYSSLGRGPEAVSLLAAYDNDFARAGTYNTFCVAMVGALLQCHRAADANLQITKTTDGLSTFFCSLLYYRAIAEDTGDASSLLSFLHANRNTLNPTIKLFAVEAMYELSDFESAASVGQDLLEFVNTAAYTELIAHSQYMCRDFQGTIDTLRAASAMFPNGKLSHRAMILYSAALVADGRICEALPLMEAMRPASLDNELEDRIMTSAAMIGDFTTLERQARYLLLQESVAETLLLGLSQLFIDRDLELCTALLHALVSCPISQDIAPTVFALAASIDQDAVARAASAALSSDGIARDKTFTLVSSEQIPILLMQQRLSEEEILNNYAQGRLPIHALAEHRSELFMRLLFDIPDDNRNARTPRSPLLAVHGSRPSPYVSAQLAQAKRLYLDITTIILMNHLGILPKLSALDARLFMSRETIRALINTDGLLQRVQPRVEAAALTITSISSGGPSSRKIYGAVSDQTSSDSADCLVLDCWRQRFISERDWQRGKEIYHLTDADLIRAPNLAHRDEKLLLDAHAAHTLAFAGLIPRLSTVFALTIDNETRSLSEQRLASFEHLRRNKKRLRTLVDDLSVQVFNGNISLTPVSTAVHDISGAGTLRSVGLAVADLLQLPKTQARDAVVCIDDRLLNSGSITAGQLPIVSISELMPLLKARGALTAEEYYDVLAAVRELLVCFIPVSETELLNAIMESSLDINGNLSESRRLSAISRYLNYSFELSESAALRGSSDAGVHEDQYFDETVKAIERTKTQVAATSLAPAPRLHYLEGLKKACDLRLRSRRNPK